MACSLGAVRWTALPFLLLDILLLSCSAGNGDNGSTTSGGTGALPGTGGNIQGTGGSLTAGGTRATGGSSSGNGGRQQAGGGAPATGGATSSGGTSAGGSSGGSGPASGGSGMGASGGSAADGGSSGTGGSSSTTGLFFTDFEEDALGSVPTGGTTWTTTLPTEYDSMGVVAIMEGGAHSGDRAAYVKKGNDGQAFLQLKDASVFPFSGTAIFVRAWIKVPEWPQNHASWIEIGAPTNEESEIRLGAHQGALQVNHWPGDQDQIAPDFTMSAETWHCLEIEYEPGNKAIHVWLDDTAVPDLTVEGSFERGGDFDPAPPIEAVRFGAEIAGTEAWFDDIAVGTERIRCD